MLSVDAHANLVCCDTHPAACRSNWRYITLYHIKTYVYRAVMHAFSARTRWKLPQYPCLMIIFEYVLFMFVKLIIKSVERRIFGNTTFSTHFTYKCLVNITNSTSESQMQTVDLHSNYLKSILRLCLSNVVGNYYYFPTQNKKALITPNSFNMGNW